MTNKTLEKMKLNLVVVLFNKDIKQSSTINSFIKNQHLFADAEVTVSIWNNGPASVAEEAKNFVSNAKNITFAIYEEVSNQSLSFIYNTLLDICATNVFFDDDTVITESYVLSLITFINTDREMFLPKIVSLGQRRYPKVNKLASDVNGTLDSLFVVSILSGISIKASLMKQLIYYFGSVFDDRFNIYGVDTSLFYRLKALKFTRYYVGSELEHDLSGISAGGANNISIFRVKERLWDFVLQTVLYRKIGSAQGLLKFVKIYRKRLGVLFILRVLVRAILFRRHPNTKKRNLPILLTMSRGRS